MVEVRYYLILSDDDYVEVTNNITTASKAYEDSVTALKQVTNPSGDFILERVKTVPTVTDAQAATEERNVII